MANSDGGLAASSKPVKLLKGVQHFNHATIKYSGKQIIYCDPYQITTEPHDADLIFITHTHYDHLSPEDIAKVMQPDTTVIVPESGLAAAKAAGLTKIVTVVPDQAYQVAGIAFKTVPAYNINKEFHPKSSGWVGYIIQINKARYYLAGDTDLIPEMSRIHADVVFLPVGGTYTTNAEEAAQAANLIKPTVAVPVHFGSIVGSVEDAQKFTELLHPKIKGIILQQK